MGTKSDEFFDQVNANAQAELLALRQRLRRFPTMLRKMWSGGEVQRWLDEQMRESMSAALTHQGAERCPACDGVVEETKVLDDMPDGSMHAVPAIYCPSCKEHFLDWRSEEIRARFTAPAIDPAGAQADARRLGFVLANGLPMQRDGQYRYHGHIDVGWHSTQVAAIDAAMSSKA